jgi:hypothetical protein
MLQIRIPAPRFHSGTLRAFHKLRMQARICFLALCLSAAATAAVPVKAPAGPALPDAPKPQTQSVTLRSAPGDILHDQAAIWTSPARIRAHDLLYLLPLGAATGIAIATDQSAMRDIVSHETSFNSASANSSNAIIGGLIATPIAIYSFGHFKDDAHAREAGILSGEAMVDGVVVEQGMKLIFWRERPTVDNYRGRFFQSSAGIDSSMPSSHSVLAFAAAASIAGDYSSRWVQVTAYSAATGVAFTRILAEQHFPSDVLVGSAAGWLIGHYVAHRHHWRWR